MVATIRTHETGIERMVRLAQKARTEGVQLLHSTSTGGYYATSGTVNGQRYAVTPHSCECKGFARFGYCKHVAALQAALGWIEKPEETPATIRCPHCVNGEVPGLYGKFSDSFGTWVRCSWCDGTGRIVDAAAKAVA